MVLLAVCPPFGVLLSLMVKVKSIVLATVGTVSHDGVKFPAKTSEYLGKYLVPEVVGGQDLKLDEVVEVVDGIALGV